MMQQMDYALRILTEYAKQVIKGKEGYNINPS